MFATTLSALYGKLLVVMGIAFPMAEVISTYIPPSFYEVRIKREQILQSLIYCPMCKNDGSQIAISSIITQRSFYSLRFFQVFYLYLYIGSMLFLFFMYTTLIWGRPKAIKVKSKHTLFQLVSNSHVYFMLACVTHYYYFFSRSIFFFFK